MLPDITPSIWTKSPPLMQEKKGAKKNSVEQKIKDIFGINEATI